MDEKQQERIKLHTQFTEQDIKYLGVPTGIKGDRPSSLGIFHDLKEQKGWLVGETGFKEWEFSGITRKTGKVIVYGPAAAGKDLFEVMDLPAVEALPYILRLARALKLLQERSVPLFKITLDGVIFVEGGDVLFLPPTVMLRIKDTRSLSYRIDAYEVVNHPYRKAEPLVCFIFGTLLYKLATGEFPFTGDTEDAVRTKVRNLSVVPPHLLLPEIREDVSGVIMSSLNKPESSSLDKWVDTLEQWTREGISRRVMEAERKQLLVKAKTQQEKAEKNLRQKVFFERHGRTVAVVSVAVIVAGLLIGSILKNVLAPRVTRGFSPAQVVEAFYTGINRLDHMTMEDATIEGAGKSEINAAISLFVMNKQIEAYEGRSPLVPADLWIEDGRPKLVSPNYVYGVGNLEISEEQGEPDPVFITTYERWSRTETDSEIGSSQATYDGYYVKDRVSLKLDKKDWVIFLIDTLETEPIKE
jgi:hypothetical protein